MLDAMGVIFEVPHVVSEYLVPFARQRGSDLHPDAVRDLYMRCTAGEIDVDEMWRQLGVDDPEGASEAYTKLHRLMPGGLDFLHWAREQRIPLACLSNDVASWSLALRERHALTSLIDLWVVSSEVGSRKPDRAIFEALREASGVPFASWVFVDDSEDNVDAAAALGATAIGFGAEVEGRLRAEGFDELTGLVAELFDVPRR